MRTGGLVRGSIGKTPAWLAVFGMLSVQGLAAGEFRPVPSSLPSEFGFDAADGSMDGRKVGVACLANALRASARITRYGTASTVWVPGVSVTLRDFSGNRATLYVSAMGFHPPLTAELRVYDRTKAIVQDEHFTGSIAGGRFSFGLAWSADGTVVATFLNEKRTVHLDGPAAVAEMVGFSAAGKFSGVTLGLDGPFTPASRGCVAASTPSGYAPPPPGSVPPESK